MCLVQNQWHSLTVLQMTNTLAYSLVASISFNQSIFVAILSIRDITLLIHYYKEKEFNGIGNMATNKKCSKDNNATLFCPSSIILFCKRS
jgi:hypothetical protein